MESPNTTLPNLFPVCRRPRAGYCWTSSFSDTENGMWSHHHCIPFGRLCFNPCGCNTSCFLSHLTSILKKHGFFSDFQPVASHCLPSSIVSYHSTLVSIPLFTEANLELFFYSAQNIPWRQGRSLWGPLCISGWPEASLILMCSLHQASLTFSIQLSPAKGQVPWNDLTCPRTDLLWGESRGPRGVLPPGQHVTEQGRAHEKQSRGRTRKLRKFLDKSPFWAKWTPALYWGGVRSPLRLNWLLVFGPACPEILPCSTRACSICQLLVTASLVALACAEFMEGN